MEEKLTSLLTQIIEKRPIVQCITNAVTVNDCANVLLAVGASVTMAHHPLEVEEIAAGSAALVCNFGAIADYEAMEKAGRIAQKKRCAIVIDPVGVSGSSYRRKKCQELMEKVHPSCIRGNYSEIRALMEHCSTVTGVDSADKKIDMEAMKLFAKKQQTILIASGEKDIITDGTTTFSCENGDSYMAKITGSGCMSSALLGAFLAMENSVESATSCCAFMGIAGELAAEKTRKTGGGTMTFHDALLDEASLMTPEKCKRCCVKHIQ